MYDEIKAASFLKIFTVLELYILNGNKNLNDMLSSIICYFA
jgi:hypothetical protein